MNDVSFVIKPKKRVIVASFLELNMPFIFQSQMVQRLFRNYFKHIDNCIRIKLI